MPAVKTAVIVYCFFFRSYFGICLCGHPRTSLRGKVCEPPIFAPASGFNLLEIHLPDSCTLKAVVYTRLSSYIALTASILFLMSLSLSQVMIE